MEKKEKDKKCQESRFDRLSRALRENLKRRKEFDRARILEQPASECVDQKVRNDHDPT